MDHVTRGDAAGIARLPASAAVVIRFRTGDLFRADDTVQVVVIAPASPFDPSLIEF